MTTTEVTRAPRVTTPLHPAFSSALPSAAIGTPPLSIDTEFDYDVAIVGLGYVGLPTALAFHHSGNRVLALDNSPQRIATIAERSADVLDDDQQRLIRALDDPGFVLTSDQSLLARAAAVIVCVPTPVDEHLVPDLAILRSACATVVDHATTGQLIVLTSTTYVGCTQDLIIAPLLARGFEAGRDLYVAFSPERIDPGNASVNHDDVPRVVGASTPECERRAEALLRRYASSVHVVHSLAAAEMTKLLENTFRAVNIALANEFADICRALDLPIIEVIDAASTKPYGFMRFMPGPGVGGHCIPCDPHYLLWQLKTKHVEAPMIRQAMTEIAARPSRVVDRARDVLSDAGRGMVGARVLVVGVAYKPNVADLRESPAIEILAGLRDRGATVSYVDDLIPAIRMPGGDWLNAHNDPGSFDAELVIIHTKHDWVDLSWIGDNAAVLDTTYRESTITRRAVL
ncbi:nucleotide sugar dehydrogenase [Salinibacterium sp. NK8237]|uniref:nucleotide sugar dehydrogenase n=1 Tax=Salinibacterium sp. NK8237 TaxID=2792038 RepID=UPI0018CF84BE|nr:nucleotide sugar dehydrogenase [Salinibacterium sp. NK8237]MBH0131072.1 nucleotide sugar dehydrogenase [Salinibacterium sp. NK8237]